MGRLFGTDGVRGIANQDLTVELAFKLGQAGAYVLTKEKKHKPTIIVGRDTRISGEMLTSALIAGICSVGADAISIGVVPTPAVAYLTRQYKADAGVVISASHNPVEYNGIKFFNDKGYKLSDALEEEIEGIILDNKETIELPTGTGVGRVKHRRESIEDYINYVKGLIDIDLSGIKVAIDCANGASYVSAPETLTQLGAEVYIIHNEPDGKNINKNCGSTHMEDLQNYVKQLGADIGIAFDGDADRCLAVDEEGKIIDGDQIMAICGLHMKEQKKLKKDTIVATVMSNIGLGLMGKENGINIEQTKVGDRYVLEEMVEKGYNLGGEQSGHIICLDYNTTGDGLIAALHLLEVLKRKGQKASELAKVMTVLPQVLVNAKVNSSKINDYIKDEVIKKAIEGLEEKFAGEGRVLIRPSGTEPLVRVMIEGKDKDVLQKEAETLANLIESRLN
ncbi:phosphoglucosamine mutase [Natranaerovirga pectinivora]|uniref:Phosphoglucosamine mutase n=1 Tax=Natranaerovirga pectinivora TaxID=682400 RepID=A0A4V2V092_9FIRM|nr:phosphoglucosamine mutase [Natranaerovirga pectinivora]TCT14663.1 phosphoglucosamine mutase [Natranaerovirga pectinivora]